MNAVEVLKLPQTNFKSRSRNTLHPNDGCVALSIYQCMHRGHVNIRKLCKCLKVDKKVSDEAQSYFFYLKYELTYSKRLPQKTIIRVIAIVIIVINITSIIIIIIIIIILIIIAIIIIMIFTISLPLLPSHQHQHHLYSHHQHYHHNHCRRRFKNSF